MFRLFCEFAPTAPQTRPATGPPLDEDGSVEPLVGLDRAPVALARLIVQVAARQAAPAVECMLGEVWSGLREAGFGGP